MQLLATTCDWKILGLYEEFRVPYDTQTYPTLPKLTNFGDFITIAPICTGLLTITCNFSGCDIMVDENLLRTLGNQISVAIHRLQSRHQTWHYRFAWSRQELWFNFVFAFKIISWSWFVATTYIFRTFVMIDNSEIKHVLGFRYESIL